MDEIIQWFWMGGYAAYIWSAYAIGVTTLTALVIWAKRQHNKVRNVY